jgi:hypothetical protein
MKPVTITLNINLSDPESSTAFAGGAPYGIIEKHACQGLNTCRGKGAGGSGTKAGHGSCATVPSHHCQSSNQCRNQGACGKRPYDPAKNACDRRGGCQVPISPQQTFDGGAPGGLDRSVWQQARKNLAARLNIAVTDLGCPPDLPSVARQNTSPSVPAYPPLPDEHC